MLKPGLCIMLLGLLLTLPLSFGPIVIGPVTLSLYWMLFGLTLSVLGLQSFFFGVRHKYSATTRDLRVEGGPTCSAIPGQSA